MSEHYVCMCGMNNDGSYYAYKYLGVNGFEDDQRNAVEFSERQMAAISAMVNTSNVQYVGCVTKKEGM